MPSHLDTNGREELGWDEEGTPVCCIGVIPFLEELSLPDTSAATRASQMVANATINWSGEMKQGSVCMCAHARACACVCAACLSEKVCAVRA